MKLKFDKNLEYQQQAIASVVDLFRGQTPMHTNFTVSAYNGQIGLFDTENGIGNRLELDEEEILKNLQEVQLRNGLPQTKFLKAGEYDFDIEMETGARVIIVTGCINVLISRVSETFIKNKSCIT
jgi:type III restriction enzyme